MPWFVFQNAPLGEEIVEHLGQLSSLQRKPIVCGAFGGPFTHSMGDRIEARRVPVYYTVRDWIVAASALVERRMGTSRPIPGRRVVHAPPRPALPE
jgi:3-hydroxypropionyl-CoA synthetase (ADP-forming)